MRKSMGAAITMLLVAGAVNVALPVTRAAAAPRPADVVAAQGGLAPLPPARLAERTAAARSRVTVPVAGNGGVPTSRVSAVLLNLTATAPTAPGSLVAHPHGSAVPDLAHVSFAAGAGASSLVTVPLGSGAVDVENRSAGSVHVTADVVGYYRSGGSGTGGAFSPVTPAKVGPPSVAAHTAAVIRVAGVAGVPQNGAAAVVLNLTASGGAGRLAAYRHGAVRPNATTLATSAAPASTQVVVQVGEDGSVEVFNDGDAAAAVAVHVVGFFRAGPATAAGTFANRTPIQYVTATADGSGPIAPGDTASAFPSGAWFAPQGASAVYSVSVLDPTASGTVTAIPRDGTAPAVPTLTFTAGHSVSSLVVLPVGTNSAIDIRNDSTAAVGVTVDELGFFTDGSLGAVTGRVTDPGGRPVEGATVDTDSNGFLDGGIDPVATGPDGRYAVSGLFPGDSYAICFEPGASRGSRSANGDLDVCFDSVIAHAGATPVTVRAGQVTADIDQRLTQAGAVTGRVTDPDGSPLANVLVDMFGSGTEPVRTAVDGTYRFRRVPPGEYQICFSEDSVRVTGGTHTTGFLPDCDKRVDVPLGRVVRQDGQLPLGAEITGRVTDADGNPVQGVKISLNEPNGMLVVAGFGPTGADGRYDIRGIQPDTYVLCFETDEATGGGSATGYVPQCYDGFPFPALNGRVKGTNVTATAGVAASGIDVRLASAGGIRGTVTNADGSPRSGVEVQVRQQNSFNFRRLETGADGTYEVVGLPAGSYSVCFFPQLGDSVPPRTGLLNQCFDNAKPSGDQPVTVALGRFTEHVDAHLNAGGQISGRVTDAAGNPLAGVRMRVFGEGQREDAQTAADGSYTLRFVYPGTAFVCFDARDATGGTSAIGYLDECYDNVPPEEPPSGNPVGTGIPVTLGQTTTGIDAALAPAGAISARATDAAGHPLTGVLITWTRVGDPFGVGDFSGSDGTVTATKLKPGQYQVCFRTDPDSTGREVTGGESEGGYGEPCLPPVTVGSGDTARIDQALPELAALSGTVTGPDGTPLPNVEAFVQNTTGGSFINPVSTKADGTWTMSRLAPGTYTVCFDGFSAQPPPGFGHQCWDHVDSGDGTPLTLTAGHRRTGIDAVLQPLTFAAARVVPTRRNLPNLN